MPDYADRRFLAEYRAATDNEIAADTLFFGHAGKQPRVVGYIPRVPLWLGRFAHRPRLTRTLSALARFAWWVTAGAPFHLLAAARLYGQMRHVDRGQMTALDGAGSVGLALSRRAPAIIVPPHIPAPSVWIVPPWVEVDPSSPGRQYVPLLALLRTPDLVKAVWLAIRFTLAYGRDRRRGSWILQTYTAVPWLLTRMALARVNADFVMAEHFDRWAVLADLTVRAQRRAGARQRTLDLVQHGNVGSLDGQHSRIKLAYRLSAVNRLYVYDDASEAVFRSEILSLPRRGAIEAHRFRPSIILSTLDGPGIFRILFVGHPLCAELQIAVLQHLDPGRVIAYYKPHPLAGMPTICEGRSWQVITQSDVFPEVDLLIGYASTLVTEYQEHGIGAVVHALTNDTGKAVSVVQEVRARLDQA